MPKDIVTEIVSRVFEIAKEFALILWNEILIWIYCTLLEWMQKDMIPLLEESLRLAFISVAAITAQILSAVMNAWQEIKQIFLQVLVEYEKSASSELWKRKATSMFVKNINLDRPTVLKREVEEEIEWEVLPQEIRNTWLKKEQKNYQVDVMDTREKELDILILER